MSATTGIQGCHTGDTKARWIGNTATIFKFGNVGVFMRNFLGVYLAIVRVPANKHIIDLFVAFCLFFSVVATDSMN